MVKNNRLAPILNQYKELPLGPDQLSNLEMGYIYEELLRRFSEQSGEEAGEHFTPREVIHLMVELLGQRDLKRPMDGGLRRPRGSDQRGIVKRPAQHGPSLQHLRLGRIKTREAQEERSCHLETLSSVFPKPRVRQMNSATPT